MGVRYQTTQSFVTGLGLSLLDLQQKQNPETILICIVVVSSPHDNTVCSHMYDEFTKTNVLNVCRMLVHSVITRANLFTSALPMRAKYMHFRTICEQTFDNSPTDPFFVDMRHFRTVQHAV